MNFGKFEEEKTEDVVLVVSLQKAVKEKFEPDGKHPASHYLYVPDPAKPSTWKLPVYNESGKPDKRRAVDAYAALTSDFRGHSVSLPSAEKKKCLSKLRALFNRQGWKWPAEKEKKDS